MRQTRAAEEVVEVLWRGPSPPLLLPNLQWRRRERRGSRCLWRNLLGHWPCDRTRPRLRDFNRFRSYEHPATPRAAAAAALLGARRHTATRRRHRIDVGAATDAGDPRGQPRCDDRMLVCSCRRAPFPPPVSPLVSRLCDDDNNAAACAASALPPDMAWAATRLCVACSIDWTSRLSASRL